MTDKSERTIHLRKTDIRVYQYKNYNIYWDWKPISDHPQGGFGFWVISEGGEDLTSFSKLKECRQWLKDNDR